MKAFSLLNIIDGNGIAISLTGMAIVYGGLVVISLFIQFLPNVIALFVRKPAPQKAGPKKSEAPGTKAVAIEAPHKAVKTDGDDSEDKDIASLIGMILHLENERLYQSDQQYITIYRDPSQPSRWGRTGHLRELPHRRSYAKV